MINVLPLEWQQEAPPNIRATKNTAYDAQDFSDDDDDSSGGGDDDDDSDSETNR
jgi:hypothetical protein